MSDNLSVVPIGKKVCRPFVLNVMVFAPEAGFKFEVSVEKSCTADADALWKLVFDLYKKSADDTFDQIVHVSYKADTPIEARAIENTAALGVSAAQAGGLINRVHPAVKALEGAGMMTPEALVIAKARVKDEIKMVVNVDA
jgi:hypothetical protein